MKLYKNKEYLENAYHELGSCKKVAEKIGCNEKTILVWAKKHGIILKKRHTGNKRHFFNEDYFEEINDQDKAYWLGFIYADGCIYKGDSPNSFRLQINLSSKDKSHLELFQKCIESNYKIQEKIVGGHQSVLLKINSTKMCLDLMNLGVTIRKSLTLKPPSFLERKYIQHFIRGYFDGDGSIKITGRDYNPFSVQYLGTKKMIDWIKEQLTLEEIGLRSQPYKKGKLWALEYQTVDSVIKTRNYFYNDAKIFLKRKQKRFQTHLLNVLSSSNGRVINMVNSVKA